MKFYKLISYVLHPVLIPIVSTLLYFIIIPNHIPKEFAYRVLAIVFVTTYIIPILLLYFLKKVKLIESYHLATIDERKFPILFFSILTFLLGKLLLKNNIVNVLAFSFFACTLAMAIVYIYFFSAKKISLHTLGIGGLIAFIGIISYEYKINLLLLIIFLFLLFGIIATSRLKLKAHTLSEIFIGFAVGFLSQIIVYASYTF
jgi:membrane-associated phospholipid phosphatase